jgi:hypothetical protein
MCRFLDCGSGCQATCTIYPNYSSHCCCCCCCCCQGGRMCRFLDCGSGCQATCTTDPNYSEPQQSPFLCPADNSTAMQCFSTDGAAGCMMTSDGVDPEVMCADGTICGDFKCGADACKAMCVVDPWYR